MMYFLACHFKNPVRGHKPGFHILRKKKAVPDIWELAFTVSLALVLLGAGLAPTDDSASPPVNPKKKSYRISISDKATMKPKWVQRLDHFIIMSEHSQNTNLSKPENTKHLPPYVRLLLLCQLSFYMSNPSFQIKCIKISNHRITLLSDSIQSNAKPFTISTQVKIL